MRRAAEESVTSLRVWTERIIVGGLAPLVVFGSRFAGNIILSRLLAPDEFGTAIAISVVLGLGGLVTDVALDRFVIINGSAQALSTAHMLAIANSLLLAGGLVVTAPVTAGLFGVANFAGSFALAAGLSAVGGFAHLGIKQIQRNYNYGPDSTAQVVANLTAMAALFLSATALRDHRAIVVSLAVQSVVYVILSHVLARTPYQLSCDKPTLRQALSFGLPLTLNGVGLAIMSQLDRVLVGYWFGVKGLAVYAVIFSMSVVPTYLIVSVFSSPSLSFLLSGGQAASDRSERYRLLLGFYTILTSLYAVWMVLTLDLLTPLIFGPSFAISPSAHVLFVLIACLRLQRSGAPTTLLLASGRTKRLALLNLSSGLGLLIAFACIVVWPRLESMLIGIAIGEFISFTIFFTSLERVTTRGSTVLIDLVAAFATPTVMAAALAWDPDVTGQARGTLLLIGVIAVCAQLSFEFYRNIKFRNLFFSVPIVLQGSETEG
jgi:O-antigen/teichoic acid export membrane protein